MGSFIFKRQPSDTRQRKYSVEHSPLGRGLGRMTQTDGKEQLEVRPGRLNDEPSGTDRRSPVLPREAR
ncbi:MAG TPA: hypothetical protein VF595_17045 [Tepidisphaeraceae bacterium]|jgi:hypothetical protein